MKLLLIFDMFQINNKTRFNMKRKKKIIIPNFYPIIVHVILYMNFTFR